MNVNKLIIDTLKPLVPDVEPDDYEGENTTYITFNYADDRAVLFGNDEPLIDEVDMQIHLFCPHSFNVKNLKKQIRLALFGAGFTYPIITEFYEKDTKTTHIIYECSMSGATEREAL